MPSHPIATWITPCNSRNVQVLGTSTRRHTIGLIPSSQTLTCTISAASASAADEAVSMTGLVRFGARVTRPAYRRSPFPVAGTPDILMLSQRQPYVFQGQHELEQGGLVALISNQAAIALVHGRGKERNGQHVEHIPWCDAMGLGHGACLRHGLNGTAQHEVARKLHDVRSVGLLAQVPGFLPHGLEQRGCMLDR